MPCPWTPRATRFVTHNPLTARHNEGMSPTDDHAAVARYPVRNDTPWDVTLVLEPWGEVMSLPSWEQVTVTVRGEHAAQAELVRGGRDVTLFAAPGTTLTVEDARGLQVLEIDIPVPSLPEGMSTRAFLSGVLDGKPET